MLGVSCRFIQEVDDKVSFHGPVEDPENPGENNNGEKCWRFDPETPSATEEIPDDEAPTEAE